MNTQVEASVIFCGYILLFIFGVIGLGVWNIKRRRERRPLEFKLLRGPGESLRRRMNKFDEDFLFQIGGAAMAPIASGLITLSLLAWLAPQLRPAFGVAAIGIVFVTTLAVSGNWALRRLMEDRDDRLGYLGERAVGETLSALVASGYRVYHDLPAEAGNGEFNVDHVAVGPNGVFAVETKSLRKRPARPGYEAHKVTYDGKRLIWPWAEETSFLEQTEARARWLRDWLNQLTGLDVIAQPVLVLPGWYVITKAPGSVNVLNHKLLANAIERENKHALTDAQIDLISRQLDERCRDVGD